MPRWPQTTILLATIPYLLLSGSQYARVKTRVYVSGAGMRSVEVAADPARRKDIARLLNESGLGPRAEARASTEGTVVFERSQVIADLPAGIGTADLYVAGVRQKPWGLYTEYRWQEEISIKADAATDVELVGMPQAQLEYQVSLPGRIVAESVVPQAEVREGTVTWKVPANSPQMTLQASSRLLRWDFLVLLVYVLAFVSYRVGLAVERAVRNRPRRI